MPTKINYDPNINANSGFLEILDAPQDPFAPPASIDPNPARPAMRLQDRQTLLHLLFWLCSDVNGRKFVSDWSTWRPKNGLPPETEPSIRLALDTEFKKRLGANKQPVIDALIEGHLAADRFVEAKQNNNQAVADAQEKLYLENMALVMWYLNEDVSEHEFSLLW